MFWFFIILGTIVLLAALAYGGVLGWLHYRQRDLLFNTEIDGDSLPTVGEYGLNWAIREERVPIEEGVRVTVWRSEPHKYGMPCVLYLHGNAGHLGRRVHRFKQIYDTDFGFYAPVHRGFPGSDGKCTENIVIKDALWHFDRMKRSLSRDHPVIVHGESLGTGIAVAVAAQRKVDAVILESPYTAIVDLVAEKYKYVPVRHMLKDKFLTRERISKMAEPLLIVHGKKDEYIDISHARKLFEMAPQPKKLVEIDEGTHITLWDHDLWDHVLQFLYESKVLGHRFKSP